MSDVYWISPVPEKCQTCGNPLTTVFYDGKTVMGPWACMCGGCMTYGPGVGKLGTGFGQEYTKMPDGRWKKTGG